MDFEKPDIKQTVDSDGNIIQRFQPQSAAATGTAKNTIESELYSRVVAKNEEQLGESPGYQWWGDDLEMYVPYLRGKTYDNANDGGWRVFMLDDDGEDSVGRKFWNAMMSSKRMEASPWRKDKVHGTKILDHFYSNQNSFLPQLEDGEQTNINGAGAYCILSHAMEDIFLEGDPRGRFYGFPSNFFDPSIYPYTRYDIGDSRNDDYTNGNYEDYYRQVGHLQYEFNPEDAEGSDEGAYKHILNGGNAYNKPALQSYVPEDAVQRGWHNCSKPIAGMIHNWHYSVDTDNTGYNRAIKNRNAVMPYVRGILNGDVPGEDDGGANGPHHLDSKYHVNGGLFHGRSADYVSAPASSFVDSEKNGAFGRNRKSGFYSNYQYDVETAFNTNKQDFSDNAKEPGNGYYIVAMQVASVAAELIGDDATNSNWYAVRIDKNIIYEFLNNKDAMYLFGRATFHGITSRTFIDFKPGIYNAKKELIKAWDANTNPFEQHGDSGKQDNLGVGDESGKWGGDDKTSPRGRFEEVVIAFRKPNPTAQGEESGLIYDGSYNSAVAEQRDAFEQNEIQPYVNMSQTSAQLKLDYNRNKNFGLFFNDTPHGGQETFQFTPVPMTFNIDDDIATLNQSYYDSDSEEAVRAGAPGTVGLIYDIQKEGGVILENDMFEKVQYGERDGKPLYHFVDSNNIGYKYAILDYGENDFNLEETEGLLEQLTMGQSSTLGAMASGLFKFEDRLTLDSNGQNTHRIISDVVVEPGIKALHSVIFNYHMRDDMSIQPLTWFLCTSRYYLGFKDYFIEDFGEIGGPGFTVFPWPQTTPIVSGISKASKYYRSLDDISDADNFSALEVIDRSRVGKAILNQELGDYVGTSDIGQMRVYKSPVRMAQQLDVPLNGDPLYHWDNFDFYSPDPGDFWLPGDLSTTEGAYPKDSPATTIFINEIESEDQKRNCLIEINPGEATNNLHRDSSGNGNKGILIGDYKLSKDDKDTPLTREGIMKVPKIGTDKRAY